MTETGGGGMRDVRVAGMAVLDTDHPDDTDHAGGIDHPDQTAPTDRGPRTGGASKPAVLLFHGQPGSRRDWSLVVHRLRDRYRIIAPDRPGYGETGGPALGLAANAEAARRLLDELGVDRAVVAGHSLGGGIALALAEHHPDRVAGLVLVGSVGTARALSFFDRVLAWPGAGEGLAYVGFRFLGRFLTASPGRAASHQLGFREDLAAVSPERLADRLERWRTEQVWRAFTIEQRALVAETPEIAGGLGIISTPTIVLAGRRDSIVPPASAEELAEAIPDAELRWVDGGHLLTIEAPEAIADAIAAVAERARSVE